MRSLKPKNMLHPLVQFSTLFSIAVLITVLIAGLWASKRSVGAKNATTDVFINGTFPDRFIWSAATSAYQIEGGWNESGKGVNICDTITHQIPNPVNATGDVAADSFHKWDVDIQLLKNIGVTLHHFDLPQPLQDIGGWLNNSSPKWFADYADYCFRIYGSMVKYWQTINEPSELSLYVYGSGKLAPQMTHTCPRTCPYQAGHNMIKAHAKAWHLYNSTYKAQQKGKVSIALNCPWLETEANQKDDRALADKLMEFTCGWFAHPIYSRTGDYPPIMKEMAAKEHRIKGVPNRLPKFTVAETSSIKGTYDYFGLNAFNTEIVHSPPPDSMSDFQMLYGLLPISYLWSTNTLNTFTPSGLENLLRGHA